MKQIDQALCAYAAEENADLRRLLGEMGEIAAATERQLQERDRLDNQAEDDLMKEVFALRGRVTQLEEALRNMIGWVKFAVEADPFYFREDREPSFAKELAEAEAALRGGDGS